MMPTDCTNYILIVEDVCDERDAARLTLEIEGYNVIAVASGQDALDYMRRSEPPCMVLLDLKMHGTNGWDFRTAQLADPRLAAIPIIVCSGDGRLDEKAEALGIVDQLAKPIDQKVLLRLVAHSCKAGRVNASPAMMTAATATAMTNGEH
jgi:twitching motility two-component system response regulator PilH